MKYDMTGGVVDLDALYAYVREHPEVPHRSRDKHIYVPYRCLVDSAIANAPRESGWYVWLKRANRRQPIYVGSSSRRKTSSLWARLREELCEEYVAFWSAVDPNAAERLKEKYGGRYSQRRAQRKKGADAIVWVACPGATQGVIDVVEHKLIWDFKPTANGDQRDYSEIHIEVYDRVRSSLEKALGRA